MLLGFFRSFAFSTKLSFFLTTLHSDLVMLYEEEKKVHDIKVYLDFGQCNYFIWPPDGTSVRFQRFLLNYDP